MSKHTPGPWRVEFIPKEKRPPVVIQIRAVPRNNSGIGRLIAEGDREEDMHVLAAAPEMLEALKNAQSRLCEHCPQYIDSASEQVGDHTDECIAAMDAIDKAEGRS